MARMMQTILLPLMTRMQSVDGKDADDLVAVPFDGCGIVNGRVKAIYSYRYNDDC